TEDIRVGCAYIFLRRSITIRADGFLVHRHQVDLRRCFRDAPRTCLDPSWVLGVMGNRCRRLRSRREAVAVLFMKFPRISLCCLFR
ncbi:hypothetical protein K525DRAFT_214325, partial [Schizophyllum commune Loenen D]